VQVCSQAYGINDETILLMIYDYVFRGLRSFTQYALVSPCVNISPSFLPGSKIFSFLYVNFIILMQNAKEMRFVYKILALNPKLEVHLQDTRIRLACEINNKIDLRDLDIQMDLFYTSLQKMQLSPIPINTQFFLICCFILLSILMYDCKMIY
jgi:hypothetical protein